MNLRVIMDSEPKVVEQKLGELPAGTKIISIYGLNGRHVAWVEEPAPKKADEKQKSKLKGNP